MIHRHTIQSPNGLFSKQKETKRRLVRRSEQHRIGRNKKYLLSDEFCVSKLFESQKRYFLFSIYCVAQIFGRAIL